jgi:hypothetical protein
MSTQKVERQKYRVTVRELTGDKGSLRFTFTPKTPARERLAGDPAKRLMQYTVVARQTPEGIAMDWGSTPDDPGEARPELEVEARHRLSERHSWMSHVEALVRQVEQWASELHWSTRRIDKRLRDEGLGDHSLPVLLLQSELTRLVLEPVSPVVPGASGVVDLSLIPTYDDIASFYLNDGEWSLHYMFPGAKAAATIKEAEAKPLSKDAIAAVLNEMKKHGS